MYIISQQVTADGKLILNLAGKSSETKPTGGVVADGSTFLEENTDAFWKLDGTWKLEKAGQMKDLPVVSAGDNGKVMKVADGAWAIGLDNGLPLSFPSEAAANANKFLGFDANGDYAAKDPPASYPTITGKNGKILGVTLDLSDNEQVEWVDAKTPLVVSDWTYDEQTQRSTCTYTSQQLFTAMQQGRTVSGYFVGDTPSVIPFLGAVQISQTTVLFAVPDFDNGKIDVLERTLADPFWI